MKQQTIAQDLYQDMHGSRNFRQGGEGGPGPSVIKIPDNVFLVLFFLVVLHLFYRMPMV